MDGFLWLILQTLPLITASAVIFFILGSRWRRQDIQRDLQAQSQKTDAESAEAQTAREERDIAKALEEKLRLKLAETQAELQESNDRQTQLQKEILRLSDELKTAQSALTPSPQPTPEISDAAPAVEAEAKKAKSKSAKSTGSSKSKKSRTTKSAEQPRQD